MAKPFFKRLKHKRPQLPAYITPAPAVDLMQQRVISGTVPTQGGYRLFECPRQTCPTFAIAARSEREAAATS